MNRTEMYLRGCLPLENVSTPIQKMTRYLSQYGVEIKESENKIDDIWYIKIVVQFGDNTINYQYAHKSRKWARDYLYREIIRSFKHESVNFAKLTQFVLSKNQ